MENGMLQNRVDPSGNLIRTKARGSFMGNRGLIHNDTKEIVRPFKLSAWLICVLEFKERKRVVMTPNLYTELFFLDEATAFAAGHRPCAECRRGDFKRFKSCWIKGNPAYHFDEKTPIRKIDAVLHTERIRQDKSKITFDEFVQNIPDGTFVLFDDKPFLVSSGKMFLWTPFGYESSIKLPEENKLTVLTPASLVNTFRAGYNPQTALSAAIVKPHTTNIEQSIDK